VNKESMHLHWLRHAQRSSKFWPLNISSIRIEKRMFLSSQPCNNSQRHHQGIQADTQKRKRISVSLPFSLSVRNTTLFAPWITHPMTKLIHKYEILRRAHRTQKSDTKLHLPIISTWPGIKIRDKTKIETSWERMDAALHRLRHAQIRSSQFGP